MNLPTDEAGLRPRAEGITFGRTARRKRGLSHKAIARRARRVVWAKRVLPAVALVLLALLLLWPEFTRLSNEGRMAMRHLGAATLNGELKHAQYRGVDQKGRAYTLTAASGRQLTPDLVQLTDPVADTTLANGSWAMVQADHGMYRAHKGELDLYGHVVLYRDDGVFVRSETATMDLKAGFAAGAHVISAEGPFGTLDATGFAIADKGAVAQFTGPARLILNARRK